MTDETQATEQPTSDPVIEAGVQVKMNEARQAAIEIPVGERGFISPENFAQMADIAKTMANSKEAVPQHVRGNLGMSIALHDMAMAWGLSPYMLANESAVINHRLGFTSHVFRSVLNKSGKLRGSLRATYKGEGEDQCCIVTGHFKNELDPVSYTTPPLKQIHPGYVKIRDVEDGSRGKKRISFAEGRRLITEGKLTESEQIVPAGSPMWDKDQEQQLFYYASRNFVRRYCPEAMLGARDTDELQDMAGVGAEHAIDVTSDVDALTARLKAAAPPVEGFSHKHVQKALNHKPKSKPKKGKRR